MKGREVEGREGHDVGHGGRQEVQGQRQAGKGDAEGPGRVSIGAEREAGAGGREGQWGEGVWERMQEEAEGTRQGEMDERQKGRQGPTGADRHLLEGAGSMRVIEVNRKTFHRYMAKYAGGEDGRALFSDSKVGGGGGSGGLFVAFCKRDGLSPAARPSTATWPSMQAVRAWGPVLGGDWKLKAISYSVSQTSTTDCCKIARSGVPLPHGSRPGCLPSRVHTLTLHFPRFSCPASHTSTVAGSDVTLPRWSRPGCLPRGRSILFLPLFHTYAFIPSTTYIAAVFLDMTYITFVFPFIFAWQIREWFL